MKEALDAEALLVNEKGVAAAKGSPLEGMKQPEVLSNVGVAGKADSPTTKFVDQLLVDRSTLQSATPKVQALSNKSRNFADITKSGGPVGTWQASDGGCPWKPWKSTGGNVEVRREAVERLAADGKKLETVPFELFDKSVTVEKVYLVYDKTFATDATLRKSARGLRRRRERRRQAGHRIVPLKAHHERAGRSTPDSVLGADT